MEKSVENEISALPVDESTTAEVKKPGIWRFLQDVVETILLSLILFWAINSVTARIRVDGYSMEPTFQDGEFVLVNKLAYRLGKMQRGDVIVFNFPRDPEEEYIKRIIGLPGDQVVIKSGRVIVNGQKIDEPYIAAPPHYSSEWIVPEDAVFVLGDNRNNSSDSHNWGPVPVSNIIGRAVLIYWPPSMWELVTHVPMTDVTP